MLIDAFPFFNELELAMFRISYLANFVDKVIVAESHLTQQGNDKPLYFTEWLPKFNLPKEKIEIIYVPLTASMGSMERDEFARTFLMSHLIDKYPKTKYILSDVDEIPSIEQVKTLLNSSGNFHFKTPTSYRRLNWQLVDTAHNSWSRAVMGDTEFAEKFNGGRLNKSIPIIDGEPGAHFSWLGIDSDIYYEKIRAFGHAELNKSFLQPSEIIEFCDKYKIDHLGRARNKGFGLLRVVASEKNNSVIFSAKKAMPELFDDDIGAPNKLFRIFASIKISVYLGNSFLSRVSRRLFKMDYFLQSKQMVIIFIVLWEAFLILINNFYEKMLYIRKNK